MKKLNLSSLMALTVIFNLIGFNQIKVNAEEIKDNEIAQLISGEAEELKNKNSYIGVGGNIGGDGNTTALSGGGLAILGKLGLMKYLSVQVTGIVNDKIAGELSLTGELPIKNKNTNKVIATPFLGGGILIHDKIDPLLTTGVTAPLTPDLSAIVKLNLGFTEKETDIGIILGIGYNFKLF